MARITPSADSGDRIGVHLKAAERAMMAAKTAALRPLGLTVPQYAALHTVVAGPGSSSAQVARACQVSPQTMGAVLAALAERGMIVRRPSSVHTGVLVAEATPRGRRLARQADAVTLRIERSFDALFSVAARAALVDGLDRIRMTAEAAGSAADESAG